MSRLTVSILFAALMVIQTGCQSNPYRQNTALGGVLGTATGAVIGSGIGAYDGKAKEGALIGAIAGGITGSAVGNQTDKANFQRDSYINQQEALARQAAVSMDQVVQMTSSGLSQELIINQIRSKGIVSAPTTNDLISLKNSGVSDSVIREMQSVSGLQYRQPQPQLRVLGPPPVVNHYPQRPPVIFHAPIPSRPRRQRSRRGFTIGF